MYSMYLGPTRRSKHHIMQYIVALTTGVMQLMEIPLWKALNYTYYEMHKAPHIYDMPQLCPVSYEMAF